VLLVRVMASRTDSRPDAATRRCVVCGNPWAVRACVRIEQLTTQLFATAKAPLHATALVQVKARLRQPAAYPVACVVFERIALTPRALLCICNAR
jgi:hypothetical protein